MVKASIGKRKIETYLPNRIPSNAPVLEKKSPENNVWWQQAGLTNHLVWGRKIASENLKCQGRAGWTMAFHRALCWSVFAGRGLMSK